MQDLGYEPHSKPIVRPTRRPLTSDKQPSVFAYYDYRKFLSEWLSAKKSFHLSYSGAVFAKMAGLQSHTLLGMVIRGDRSLTPTTIRAFSRALELNTAESLYFEKLVLFNQAKNSDDKGYYFDQLVAVSKGASREILTKLHNYSLYLSRWYVVAVRELVGVVDFRLDVEWIAARLKGKITKKQAQEAWDIIVSLKLVEQDEKTGRYKIVHPQIDLDPGTIDFAIQNYHKDFLQRTKEAIDGESFEDRSLSSFTMSISKEDLPELKKQVMQFQKDLNTKFPISTTDRTEVVAVNAQILVLTQKQEEKKI